MYRSNVASRFISNAMLRDTFRTTLIRLFSRSNAARCEELPPSLDLKQMLLAKEDHMRNIVNRKMSVDFEKIEMLYRNYCNLTTLMNKQNRIRKELAARFAQDNAELRDTLDTMGQVYEIKERLENTNTDLGAVTEKLNSELALLPNDTHPSVPIGGEGDSVEIERFGPHPVDGKCVNDHMALAKQLDIVDFESGANTSGSSFYFLKNQGVLLENALVQYVFRRAIKAGFRPIKPPDIVYGKFIKACGFLPRSEETPNAIPAYTVSGDGPTRVLSATAEIPLAAYNSGRILEEWELPIKWVAFSHCFRPETGHHGSETRGLYRVHQFTKVELFILKDNGMKSSDSALQEILALQKSILNDLGLSCRILNMASAELGASAYQKYDIEAWFPARSRWGELTSSSNCTDYQSRRLMLRYRPKDRGPLQFAHTLNGTACAVPRIIQAILENNQQHDGSVAIPSVLHPYMLDGSTAIKKV